MKWIRDWFSGKKEQAASTPTPLRPLTKQPPRPAARSREPKRPPPKRGPVIENLDDLVKTRGAPGLERALKASPGSISLQQANDSGRMPIHEAALVGDTRILSILIEHGAELEARTRGFDEERTPLIVAAREGRLEAVQLLLERGANVNAKDEDHATPLLIATVHRHPDVVKILIESGADPTISGAHPLRRAVCDGSAVLAEMLIASGLDPDLPCARGNSLLIYAAHHGHRDVIEVLLRHNARKDFRNPEGHTPADIARSVGHPELADLLAS